jgi:integrase
MAGKLTARTVTSLTAKDGHTPGRHTDGDGLHLHIRADGAAAWVLRFRLHEKQRDMGLGGYPAIGLAEARQLARDAKSLVLKGVDPTRERRQARVEAAEAASGERSFRSTAEAMIEARRDGWRNAKHAAQWTSTLTRHVYPTFGSMPVAQVDTDAVLRVLRPIWSRTPETASRVRGRIEAVMDFARARGWRSGENPARWRGHLAELLPPPRKVAPVAHQPSLAWQKVPAFLNALAEHRGIAAHALRFAILTAVRTGEARGMRWSEVDLPNGVWVIPGRRMKAGQLHRVPLSEEAKAVLEEMKAYFDVDGLGREGLVFPGGRKTKPLSDMALSMLVRGMALDGLEPSEPPRWRDAEGRAVVPHGFRASFRGWTRAQGWPDHLGEIALEQNPNVRTHWGFPERAKSDSPCLLGMEASRHGQVPVRGSSLPSDRRGRRRHVAARCRRPLRGLGGQRHSLAASLARHRCGVRQAPWR